ncbi:MAG: VTC domain-containing protein, partial [Bacteroidota bacterium]
SMRPVECVIYEREPYVCRFDSTMRVTLDINLRSTLYPSIDDLFSEEDVVPALPNHFILEVKFDEERGFPRWIRPIISRFYLTKQALSKYCICLDTHGIVHEGRRNMLSRAPL